LLVVGPRISPQLFALPGAADDARAHHGTADSGAPVQARGGLRRAGRGHAGRPRPTPDRGLLPRRAVAGGALLRLSAVAEGLPRAARNVPLPDGAPGGRERGARPGRRGTGGGGRGARTGRRRRSRLLGVRLPGVVALRADGRGNPPRTGLPPLVRALLRRRHPPAPGPERAARRRRSRRAGLGPNPV